MGKTDDGWVEPVPCALCGVEAHYTGFSVSCRGCGIAMPERGDEDYFLVTRRWNRLMVNGPEHDREVQDG